MGWQPYLVQPDRAHGAGLAFGQIPQALSDLCLAVNQRESQMYFGSIPETQFYYTGDGTSGPKKSRPLASDWQVYPIRSTDANTFICNVLKSIKAAIKAMVDAYNIPRLSDITQHQKYWLKQYKSAYATPTYTVPLVDVSAALSEFWEFENTGSRVVLYQPDGL